jgi:tetratricopeptide (TPR) repeat protein
VSRHAAVEAIDCVELCRGVIDAAKYFIPSNHRVLENPKVSLRIEDARNYILATQKRYDLILSDSIHPAYAGNGTLYSKDYFELCREKLNPGGYVSFWMPTYMLSPREYKTTIKTFQSVFPNVSIWYVSSAIEAYTIVIGRVEPLELDVARLRERLADPPVARDLAQVEVHDALDVLGYFVMGPQRVREFVAGADVNTDDHPVIELRGPKSMTRRRTWYKNLKELAEMREPVDPYLVNVPGDNFLDDLSRLYRATGVLIEGQLLDISSYDFEQEYRRYQEADEIYPGNPAFRRLMALTLSRVLAFRGERLMRQGKQDEARELFERAIAVNPDPADDTVGHSYFRIGTLLLQKGEVAAGRDAIEKCLAVLPTHKKALMTSASLDMRANRREEARRTLDKLAHLYPGDDEVEKLRRRL